MKITEYLAIYAAVLSTFTALWNIYRSRERIKVTLYKDSELDGIEFRDGASITIKNMSPHTVHLLDVSIVYPFRKASIKDCFRTLVQTRRLPLRINWAHSSLSIYDIDSKCPSSLEERKSLKIFIPDAALQEVRWKALRPVIRAAVQDQLYKYTYSSTLYLDRNIEAP